MRRIGVLRSILGPALGGVLVGFVFAAFGSAVLGGDPLAGRPREPAEARQYMKAVLERNLTELNAVRPAQGLAQRAAEVGMGDGNTQGWEPVGLSYLGGGEKDGLGIHVYVAEIRPPDGSTPQLVSFSLTLVDGKVVRVQ